ncbi:helix-turn-helix transcriptional regulator [Nocardia iowensis]|uniref:Helix-turn-helix transcriptional regulator n=1 Tax=Nocardia iowensis TaxID=204891 RepID=A0ABX8RPI2_NOCIO|nr:helix-turn-helix transcriptional regulator [Nocardia iowensis]QXN90315.1 helix-turn-helix transcriptional regulator [Nocardia iowensis]
MANGTQLSTRTALRDAMTAEGLSVRQLAKRAGCGKSIIGLLRSGARRSCSPELAAKIAAALDIPIHELFPDEKDGGTD